MRRCTFFTIIAAFLCLIFCKNSFAQTALTDSSSQQNALNNTLALYYGSVGKQSPLYNGMEYSFYDPTLKGTAYFLDTKAFTPGTIYYDRVLFSGVPMLYDEYSDQVVVLLYNHFTKFSLIKQKVTSFDFLDHHFVNIGADSLANNTIIKPGFYDELYKGKVQVLAKRSKNIQTSTGGQGQESYFNLVQEYYIRKNNVYYSISSQGSLLDVLKDKKKDLQQYIRTNQIKFRREPEEAMVKIASYYDHLTK